MRNIGHTEFILMTRHGFSVVRLFLPIIGLGLLCALPALSETPTAPPSTIVLISLDTTRADHLSCYGYEHETTPNIDALARESLFFEQPFAPTPMTQPSHSSLFTGLIPPSHGVHENFQSNLSSSALTLAEILKENGFTTYGIVSSHVLKGDRGYSQGFDKFDDAIGKRGEAAKRLGAILERNAQETTARALQWLNRNAQKKKFMFIHYFDPHDDYEPPAPFDTKFENPYDGEIAFMDHYVGQLLDRLKALGLYDNALIALVGDHGEMLDEHGEATHGYFIYQNVLRVPMMFKLPGPAQSRKVTEPCSLIDVAPTLLSMVRLAVPETMQGVDLSSYLDPKFTLVNRPIYSESVTPTVYNCSTLLGIVMGQWHYIHANRPELYDRLKDPAEVNNLIAQYPAQANEMKDRLKHVLREAERSHFQDAADLDAESKEQLLALGYLDGDVTIDYSMKQGEQDAKDMLLVSNRNLEAMELGQAGREEKAIRIHTEVIEQHPNVRHTYHLLSVLHSSRGEVDKAIAVMQKQLTLFPDYMRGLKQLCAIYEGQRQYDNAIGVLNKIIALEAKDALAYKKLIGVYLASGRIAEAIETVQRKRAVLPDDVETLMMIGRAFQQRNDAPNALPWFLDALAVAPDSVPGHVNAGSMYYKMGNMQKALSHFEQALALDSNLPNLRGAVEELRSATKKASTPYGPQPAVGPE